MYRNHTRNRQNHQRSARCARNRQQNPGARPPPSHQQPSGTSSGTTPNADGIQDDGEPGFGGVTVRLLDAEGNPVTGGAGNPLEAITGDDGRYALQGEIGQTYVLEFVLLASAAFTTPDAGDDTRDNDANQTTGRTEKITLKAGEMQDWWDAGLVVPQPEVTGQNGGIVWIDANKDGIRNEDEAGPPNASVTLYYANDTPVNATKTNMVGRYLFTGLPQGDYYLAFDLPQGYTFTAAGQGDDDTRNSDADPETGRTSPGMRGSLWRFHSRWSPVLSLARPGLTPTPTAHGTQMNPVCRVSAWNS
ncbi:MAG: SdrD B-like domain-containing protein [Candidatus Methanoculleus thermohydrogenotrophicum]